MRSKLSTRIMFNSIFEMSCTAQGCVSAGTNSSVLAGQVPMRDADEGYVLPPPRVVPSYDELKLVAISYAQGCCLNDQIRCADTASAVAGITDVRMYNGSILDPDFTLRNKFLLEFPRLGRLIRFKTPSAKKGYFVWKPYVVLKTLEVGR